VNDVPSYPGHGTNHNSRKTHCPNNHEYDSVDSRGYRYCLTCKLAKQKEARRIKRERREGKLP
jgi:hypothetical protein